MGKPFACPVCGGRLRYVVTAALEYSLDPSTGETGSRILTILDGAYGEPGARCTKCGATYWAVMDGGRVTELSQEQ